MMEPVVELAEGQEVGGIGGAAVFPVADVVHVQPPVSITTGNPTPPVAVLDGDASAIRDDPECPTHAHGLALDIQHGPDPAVTAQVPTKSFRQARTEVKVTTLAGPQVEQDQVSVPMGTGDRGGGQDFSAMETNASAQEMSSAEPAS